MAIYTIGDLHLSFSADKPMDVFGYAWQNHTRVLSENWKKTVCDEDTVVLVGDHSWALKPEDAIPDLTFIHQLPGKKILMKGNHDLWWPTARKLQTMCQEAQLSTLSFLQGSAVTVQDGLSKGVDAVVCGTRGWLCPGDRDFGKMDEAVYRREGIRLETALKAAAKEEARAQEAGRSAEIIGFLHYPPFGNGTGETVFTELFTKYGVKRVFYGHLHGIKPGEAKTPEQMPIQFTLVSGDYISFNPVCIGLNS